MGITKELLTVEFRYNDVPKGEHDSGHISKTITIGVFDTLDEAITEGNKLLDTLSKTFQVRERFKKNHLFGFPNKLVTNTSYPTYGIQYFAKIETLKFDDLAESINETFKAYTRYRENENS